MLSMCIGILGFISGTLAYGVKFGLCWGILCMIFNIVTTKRGN